MFAVVEHQQQLRLAQALQDVVEKAGVRPLAHPENTGNRVQDQLGIEHGRQIDQPRAIAGVLDRSGRDLDRQSGLSGPAGPGQGDQAGAGEQHRELLELPLASHEAGELGQQIVAARLHGAKRREVVGEVRVVELEEMLAALQLAQPVQPQVTQRRFGREIVADQLAHGA